jgi:hypothetical protein
MKRYLRGFIYVLVDYACRVVSCFYKVKNLKKKKILVYTDSRGFEISSIKNRKNPFGSYIGYFIKNYKVDYYLCREKHTTIIDFLHQFHKNRKNYDYIIIQLGVVDFSPRPKSMVKDIYNVKKNIVKKLFDINTIENHLKTTSTDYYEGKETLSLYSLAMAENYILPELLKIDNLIWIGCNKVLPSWDGNYPRKRPKNMYIIEDYTQLFHNNLQHSINILDWDEEEIKQYTCDNIHLTEKGMEYLRQSILSVIDEM